MDVSLELIRIRCQRNVSIAEGSPSKHQEKSEVSRELPEPESGSQRTRGAVGRRFFVTQIPLGMGISLAYCLACRRTATFHQWHQIATCALTGCAASR